MSKTVKDIAIEARAKLKEARIDTPELDTRLLLADALGIESNEILLKYSDIVTDTQVKTMESFVAQRLARKPVSRILGYNYFWRSKFKISDETLDPRPDTETIIQAVLDRYKKDERLNILDLGTGSGCILLSLLFELENSEGAGLDISSNAIETAQLNAIDIGVGDRVEFIAGSWNDIDLNKTFDIVVSNPPYIEDKVIEGLEPEVKDYDPHTALSGGEDGLTCYRDIAKKMPNLLNKDGMLFLEIGYDQKQKVKEVLASHNLSVIKTLQDLTGNDRCIVAKWAE